MNIFFTCFGFAFLLHSVVKMQEKMISTPLHAKKSAKKIRKYLGKIPLFCYPLYI
jgi:hypothetical protein